MTAPLPNGLMRHEPIDAIRFPLEPIAPPSLSCVVCETNDAAAFALPLGALKVRTFGRVAQPVTGDGAQPLAHAVVLVRLAAVAHLLLARRLVVPGLEAKKAAEEEIQNQHSREGVAAAEAELASAMGQLEAIRKMRHRA